MKLRKLHELGVPKKCFPFARHAIGRACAAGVRGKEILDRLQRVARDPEAFMNDEIYGEFARAVFAHSPLPFHRGSEMTDKDMSQHSPIAFSQWGSDLDDASLQQMRDACALPVSRHAALMPDAHVGYGLPIGGVLATENAVIPYAVGVDIACRMKLSITDLPVSGLTDNASSFDRALEKGTRFGVGAEWTDRPRHDVLDADWSISPITQEMKDRAWNQLGTSGSGNHFVEWGVLTIGESELSISPGKYVALLSHSGSRGAGARVCEHYSRLAESMLPKNTPYQRRLAWLSLDSQEGQEYWDAMNLMGEYASANHAVIHQKVLALAGALTIAGVENHHNFAWKESHFGREVIVHRKGSTPAGEGVLGVIPGNMADTAFVVRGKGNAESLSSAAHGAGRCMSRTEAKRRYRWNDWKGTLEKRGVRVLAAGVDEVPGVYKNIHEVMEAQKDLVDVVATFEPRIVMMCNDNSRAED